VRMALAQALRGFTSHAGQGCAMNTRVLVHNSLREDFVEQLAQAARAVKVGDPVDPTTEMGPLIRSGARDRVERYVALGLESGAKLKAGGRRPPTLGRGFYFEPTLFDDADPDAAIAQDEIFGPVGVVIGFDDDEEAVALANRSRFGLRGGIISHHVWRFADLATRLEFLLAGFGWCNMPWHMIEEHVAAGRLKRLVIAEEEPVAFRLYVVSERGRKLGRAGRWLLADLRERLKTCPTALLAEGNHVQYKEKPASELSDAGLVQSAAGERSVISYRAP